MPTSTSSQGTEPGTARAPDAAEEEARYVVLHTALDNYFRGQVITLAHLRAGLDRPIDLGRLLRLGAIAPVGSRAAEEARAALEAEGGAAPTTPAGDPVDREVPLPALDTTHPDHPARRAKKEAAE